MNFNDITLSNVDLHAFGTIGLIAGLTLGAMVVKLRFPSLATRGRLVRTLAHAVVIEYSVIMMIVGTWVLLNGRLPLPAGGAWEGPVAFFAGVSAFLSGGCTLLDHVLQQRGPVRSPATAVVVES
ncbi:MAG: hypothetical protein AAF533_20955 [Acidobacteriota bacterium]